MSSHLSRKTENPEAEWIEQIAAGNTQALENLFGRYQEPLFRYFFGRLGNPERAEELVIDAFVAVWQGAARYRGASRVSTWIFGIAHHKLMNEWRRGKPQTEDIDSAAQTADSGQAPDAGVVRGSQREKLEKALGRLSAEHREVIELTFYNGFSYGEIAEIQGCPVNTVKTRMFHARKQLQTILKEMGIGRDEL